jgi:hypothetical protein
METSPGACSVCGLWTSTQSTTTTILVQILILMNLIKRPGYRFEHPYFQLPSSIEDGLRSFPKPPAIPDIKQSFIERIMREAYININNDHGYVSIEDDPPSFPKHPAISDYLDNGGGGNRRRFQRWRKSQEILGLGCLSSRIPPSAGWPFCFPNLHSKYKRELSNDHDVRIFEIPGQLADHFVEAIGDYGAKRNFIKEKYAIRLGLPINRSVVHKVTVGSGKEVTTVGTATAPFRFKGEYGVHDLEFCLLAECLNDIILGKPFLKLTETFSIPSNFRRRVRERVVRGISQFRLLYLGTSSPMFEGSINGQPQTALADSGAKVLVMDEAYAQSIRVPIHIGHEDRTRLKFADNSIADTSGMAYDVEWRFGRDGEFSPPYWLNFHILKNAPANIILCDTFLFDNEAFSRYHHYLIDNDDDYEDENDKFHCLAIDCDRGTQGRRFAIP